MYTDEDPLQRVLREAKEGREEREQDRLQIEAMPNKGPERIIRRCPGLEGVALPEPGSGFVRPF